MRTSDFDYVLPDDRIAAVPVEPRDESRLMQVERHGNSVRHLKFRELCDGLAPGSLVVLNDTRVLPARLLGHKASGGAVELLLIRRVMAGASEHVRARASSSTDPDSGSGEVEQWEAIGRNLAGVALGTQLTFGGPSGGGPSGGGPSGGGSSGGASSDEGLVVELIERGAEGVVRVLLRPPAGKSVLGMLDLVGHVPLPPYIEAARRKNSRAPVTAGDAVASDTPPDRERYQTVYAARPGAVAAPTAGLHFTAELLAAMRAAGHQIAKLTLHVGLGTFRPVKVDDLDDHVMEAESYTIPPETASAVEDARRWGRPVVAVGTTVVRALETAVRAGEGVVRPGTAESRLFLRPGDTFHVVSDLITNFHLPRSTLLMLVAAFAGRERVLAAYAEAIARGYRFYSYGDAMWIRGSR